MSNADGGHCVGLPYINSLVIGVIGFDFEYTILANFQF